jgi:hypothetical protein
MALRDQIISAGSAVTRAIGSAVYGWMLDVADRADFVTSFAGSPENNVTAGPGTYCADTTNGEGYIKHTGTGNTGWKLITHA